VAWIPRTWSRRSRKQRGCQQRLRTPSAPASRAQKRCYVTQQAYKCGATRRAQVSRRSFGVLSEAETSPHRMELSPSEQKARWRSVPGAFRDLLCGPIRCRMPCHLRVEDFSVGVPNHEEDMKQATSYANRPTIHLPESMSGAILA
jgi:hypothetical protein